MAPRLHRRGNYCPTRQSLFGQWVYFLVLCLWKTSRASGYWKTTARPVGRCHIIYVYLQPTPSAIFQKIVTDLNRGEICQCRYCRRQCKIFASGVNFSRNNAIYNINESKKCILSWFSSLKLLTYYWLAHLYPKNAKLIDIWCIYTVNLREKCHKLRTFAV